jgi:alkylation response protein AidB-like acyl-CoA dehydrogenase
VRTAGSVRTDDVLADAALVIERVRARLDEMTAVALPGSGRTAHRWRWLVDVARQDLSFARLAEGHLDARAIATELGRDDLVASTAAGVWGVWAAEPTRLLATRCGRDRWQLHGEKRWCSGSTGLDGALVTATADDGVRLFVVDPRQATVEPGSWRPLGMAATVSHTLCFDLELAADAGVGGPGAYVERPGFWHGGAGVAACWYGGAIGVAEGLRTRVVDDASAATWGRVRSRLDAAGALLEHTAACFDAAPTDAIGARRRAIATRLAVEELADRVLHDVTRSCGAGAPAHDVAHATRVADLTMYLRQLHTEADARAHGNDAMEPYEW